VARDDRNGDEDIEDQAGIFFRRNAGGKAFLAMFERK
jgi:hypothetical protein